MPILFWQHFKQFQVHIPNKGYLFFLKQKGLSQAMFSVWKTYVDYTYETYIENNILTFTLVNWYQRKERRFLAQRS